MPTNAHREPAATSVAGDSVPGEATAAPTSFRSTPPRQSRRLVVSRVGDRPDFREHSLGLYRPPGARRGVIRQAEELVALARQFNVEVARPHVLELERATFEDHDFLPHDLVRACNDWGLFSLMIPKMFGGQGYDISAAVYFFEEIATVCPGVATLIGLQGLGTACLMVSGNLRVARRLFDDVLRGEQDGRACMFAVSVTEPNAGTDLQDLDLTGRGQIGCRATKVEGGYLVNGSKVFSSNGHFATWDVLYTCTDPARPVETMVVLAVRAGTEGFTLGRFEDKMGQRLSPASTLNFDNCFVPDDLVILDQAQRRGFSDSSDHDIMTRHFDYWLCMSRVSIAAMAAGAARGAFEAAAAFADETQLRGMPMIDHGWVQSRLAEMYANARLARLAYIDAAGANALSNLMTSKLVFHSQNAMPWKPMRKVLGRLWDHPRTSRLASRMLLDRGLDQRLGAGLGSMAKFAAADLAMKNCQIALELMGSQGTRHEGRVEKLLRDTKLLQIYEGTAQLNRVDTFKSLIAPGYQHGRLFAE
ncbi:acyl-CoA dehydrogenase family protein [Streptomyces sp. NPDC002623]